MSQYDKIGYILCGGILSLLLVLLIEFFLFESPLKFGDIPNHPALFLLIAITFQSVAAAGMGYIWGRILHIRNNPKNARQWEDREQPWDYIIEKIRQEEVRVITQDQKEIHGIVSRFGSANEAGDLVLGSPTFIIRTDGDKQKEYSIGNEAYIYREDIAQIHYKDEEYLVDDDAEAIHEPDPENTGGEALTEGIPQWFKYYR